MSFKLVAEVHPVGERQPSPKLMRREIIISIIFYFLQQNKRLSITDVVNGMKLDDNRRTLQRAFNDLENAGVIEGDHSNPRGFVLTNEWKNF